MEQQLPIGWIRAGMTCLQPLMEMGWSYVLPPDHSIPPEVKSATLQNFFERGRRMTARR